MLLLYCAIVSGVRLLTEIVVIGHCAWTPSGGEEFAQQRCQLLGLLEMDEMAAFLHNAQLGIWDALRVLTAALHRNDVVSVTPDDKCGSRDFRQHPFQRRVVHVRLDRKS